ncbi:MAG: pilus assembly protein TadG-related protein [Phenylobacterium sp.]
MIFAVAAVPITLLTGMGVDYTLAIDRQVQLNAAADAAVLAAITPTMMTQPTDVATQAAKDTFNAQAGSITGVTYAPTELTVNIATTGAKRVVTLGYTAHSQNIFAGVLHMDTIAVAGGSQGTGGQAPNIDFYLLLDDSPSMAIGAAQSDIDTMMANTKGFQDKPNGCAFACHETHPSSDNLGNPGGVDNYALARSLGVTLRIDLVKQAAQNLMDTAISTKTSNNAAYRAAIYTFDTGFNTVSALTSDLNSTASSSAKTKAGAIDVQVVYQNNWLTSTNKNDDTNTDYANAITKINTAMPDPGSGTAVNGDKPQEVLFFVTDGVNDSMINGTRVHSVMDPAKCATIKGRGIRIAVLYTEYLPLPTDQWYKDHVASFQSNIGPSLQSCASPGLYTMVTKGGDISGALATLFQYAVQSAYLSQ